MSDDYKRSYFRVHTGSGSTYVPDEAFARKHKERMKTVGSAASNDLSSSSNTSVLAPDRPSDTISFFALAFIAGTLLYCLPLKGSSFETAFTYALGAGVLGAAAGVVAVALSRFLRSLRD